MVDPFQFGTLEDLREELVSIVAEHIADLNPVPRVVFGEPFCFVRSHLVEVPTGLEVRTLAEFRRAAAEVDMSAIYLHTLDARVRRGVPGGHFAQWSGRELGLVELADRLSRVNPYLGGLEDLRRRILELLDAELAAKPSTA